MSNNAKLQSHSLKKVKAEISSLEQEGYSYHSTLHSSDGYEYIFVHSRNSNVIRIWVPVSETSCVRLYKNGLLKKVI